MNFIITITNIAATFFMLVEARGGISSGHLPAMTGPVTTFAFFHETRKSREKSPARRNKQEGYYIYHRKIDNKIRVLQSVEGILQETLDPKWHSTPKRTKRQADQIFGVRQIITQGSTTPRLMYAASSQTDCIVDQSVKGSCGDTSKLTTPIAVHKSNSKSVVIGRLEMTENNVNSAYCLAGELEKMSMKNITDQEALAGIAKGDWSKAIDGGCATYSRHSASQ
jgi:hypothetical protein